MNKNRESHKTNRKLAKQSILRYSTKYQWPELAAEDSCKGKQNVEDAYTLGYEKMTFIFEPYK